MVAKGQKYLIMAVTAIRQNVDGLFLIVPNLCVCFPLLVKGSHTADVALTCMLRFARRTACVYLILTELCLFCFTYTSPVYDGEGLAYIILCRNGHLHMTNSLKKRSLLKTTSLVTHRCIWDSGWGAYVFMTNHDCKNPWNIDICNCLSWIEYDSWPCVCVVEASQSSEWMALDPMKKDQIWVQKPYLGSSPKELGQKNVAWTRCEFPNPWRCLRGETVH